MKKKPTATTNTPPQQPKPLHAPMPSSPPKERTVQPKVIKKNVKNDAKPQVVKSKLVDFSLAELSLDPVVANKTFPKMVPRNR